MILIITEKPSVGATIANVLGANEKSENAITGNGYLVSWCLGHLVGLAEPAVYGEQHQKWTYDSLPILPREWKYTVLPDKRVHFMHLKELMQRTDVSEVVNACDAGREGELIFRFVYELADCRKPMRRLWISSLETSAIRNGLAHLKDGHDYDPLYASALCRAKADWLVGINATRLFSCLYGRTLNIGRVQTPTLKMLVDRHAAIATFKKEKYYHVRLLLSGTEAVSERLTSTDEAHKLKVGCETSQATCRSIVQEAKSTSPPRLFDLTTLQRETNRLFGYTAKQTLDLAQSLYEKQLLTYPRTDSCYLTDDMGETAADIISMLCKKLPFMKDVNLTPEVSRLLNSKKVSDHHAIIPTVELAKADLSALPETERRLLLLVCTRLLMATAQPHTFEAVTASFSCAGQTFTSKTRVDLNSGWKSLEQAFLTTLKIKPDLEEDNEIENATGSFSFTEGQTFLSPTAKITEHDTTPPKPYTEATLLAAMERAGSKETHPDAERRGLGTPATRAAIIEKLINNGFVARKGKQLLPTNNGIELVNILPDNLTSPNLTAEWENELLQIAHGQSEPDHFIQHIETMLVELVAGHPPSSGNKKGPFSDEHVIVGKCPRCSGTVYEGRKNYYCNEENCSFAMWKNDRFFQERKIAFSKKLAAELLNKGSAHVKRIYSPKTGKTYEGVVVLADTGDKYVNFRITLPQLKRTPAQKSKPVRKE